MSNLLKKRLTFVVILSAVVYSEMHAQKLKCKLVFKDSIYVGSMKPNWFNKITLKPVTSDFTKIKNARGTLYSEKFGNAGYSIVKNKLNTIDSLMIRATFGWHPINKIEITKGILEFEWNWSFRPDPVLLDLEILKKAANLINDETSWERVDDRKCKEDSTSNKYSLYCAIYCSTMNLTADFNHRGAALEVVRKTIRETNPDKQYQHDLMDFNNQNSFNDVKSLLLRSMESLSKSLMNVSK